jgi:hypothetical protein
VKYLIGVRQETDPDTGDPIYSERDPVEEAETTESGED